MHPATAVRLLLVDDDRTLAGILAEALEEEGYAVTQAHDGRQGLAAFSAAHFDLVLLDVLMPEFDGLEVCRRLRRTSRVPVVLLTSRADEVDRISGLDLGADDYVVKPFSTRELLARIRALLRRTARASHDLSPAGETPSDPAAIALGDLCVTPSRFEVTWHGASVALTRSEFWLLHALAQRPGMVRTRDVLLDAIRGPDASVTDRTIDTLIKRIRHKLSAGDTRFEMIETVVGVGYRINAGR